MGWSLLRSVPRFAGPVIKEVPVAPPNESIATVPSWQERQSRLDPPGWPIGPASSVGLLYTVYVAVVTCGKTHNKSHCHHYNK